MKHVSLPEIFDMRFSLSDISTIYQTNAWSVCHHPDGRLYNGFLLFDSGECSIISGGEEIKVTPGTLVYLPTGSTHRVVAKERSLHFYRINFIMTDLEDGERIVFSRGPLVITENVPRQIFTLAEQMCSFTLVERGLLKNISHLSELLDFACGSLIKSDRGRIGAAVRYVEEHYTEDIDVEYLASLCYISVAHLFRLFGREVGMSPVKYKNYLRIKKAEELLLDKECSVAEVAELVGFESCPYFSRTFKEISSYSPLEYRRKYL